MTFAEQLQQQLSTLPPDKLMEVLDFVTYLQKRAQSAQAIFAEEEHGRQIKAALEALTDLGPFIDIADPAEWQRKMGKDNPLPGREEK